MPKYTKKDRNPFTLLLLRHLIESEACWVFGPGRSNLERYLAIPKLESHTTLSSIRSYRYSNTEIAEECTNEAKSTVSKVIQRPKEYRFSDDMLDRIVHRISFYGTFQNFSAFHKRFGKWARKYDKYIGVEHKNIPPDKLSQIVDDAFDIYSAERIYLMQLDGLDGTDVKGIIRLTDNHIIRQSINYEFDDRQEYRSINELRGYITAENAHCVDDSYIEDKRSLFCIHYTIIGPHCDIVGDLVIIPTVLNNSTKLTKEYLEENINLLAFFEEDGFINPNTIFVRELYGSNLNIFYTFMFRLCDIIMQHPDAEFKKNTTIIVASDDGIFSHCKHILGFLPAKSNNKTSQEAKPRKLILNDNNDFYINNLNSLINRASKGLGYNLY